MAIQQSTQSITDVLYVYESSSACDCKPCFLHFCARKSPSDWMTSHLQFLRMI